MKQNNLLIEGFKPGASCRKRIEGEQKYRIEYVFFVNRTSNIHEIPLVLEDKGVSQGVNTI